MSVRCRLRFFLLLLITILGCSEKRPPYSMSYVDSPGRFSVRVLLCDNIKSFTFKSAGGFKVVDGQSKKTLAHANPRSPITISLTSNGVSISNRNFVNTELVLEPGRPGIITVNGQSYHGQLKIIRNSDGQTFDVINKVGLEPYIAGVLGAEMPDYWESQALQAQAIVARTYCLYIQKRFGANRNWDVRSTQASQVYQGIRAESRRVWQAVNKTDGQVLVCWHNDDRKNIFPTYYSSSCGGHTENSKNVFGDEFRPLSGVECPYCKYIAKPSVFYWPKVTFSKADASAAILKKYPKLKSLGQITDIIAAKTSDYGHSTRLTSIKLTGDSGKVGYLRAEDLRLTLDSSGTKLRSTICKIIKSPTRWEFTAGRGFGHGVGMCQCGAEQMAREGKTAADILSYYYPGSQIDLIDYYSN
jgi:stage II sporulation protein D